MDSEKTTLWNFIQKNDFPWAIQIIQNILAVAEMIPLRLYNAEKASKIWKELNYSSDVKNLGKDDPENFGKILKEKGELIEFFRKRENSPWVTRSSYGHPLLDEFHREFPVFRVWEQIFIYSWTQDMQDKQSDIIIQIWFLLAQIMHKQFQIFQPSMFLIYQYAHQYYLEIEIRLLGMSCIPYNIYF